MARAVDEQVPQALAGWRPTLRAFGNAGVREIDSNQETIIGSEDALLAPNAVGAEIDQPLFRGGQTVAQTRQAENAVRAERARLTSTEQRVLFDAATAYVDVFRDQSELALNIRNEQRLDRQLQATRDRFQVGEVTLDPAAANRITYGPDTEFTVNFTNQGEHDEVDIRVSLRIEGGPEELRVERTVESIAAGGAEVVRQGVEASSVEVVRTALLRYEKNLIKEF